MNMLGAEGRAGPVRRAHAQGRHERGAARLGHQRRRHVLLHRHRRGPASLSGDGARFPVRHRRRGRASRCRSAEGRLPDSLVACIGGGSNAIGLFHPFLDDASVEIYGVEAAGHGLDVPDGHCRLADGRHARACCTATAPICCRTRTARSSRAIRSPPASTIPASAPSTPGCSDIGRVTYLSATDKEALDAFQLCCKLEGIIPALEPAHALAKVIELAPQNAARTT